MLKNSADYACHIPKHLTINSQKIIKKSLFSCLNFNMKKWCFSSLFYICLYSHIGVNYEIVIQIQVDLFKCQEKVKDTLLMAYEHNFQTNFFGH